MLRQASPIPAKTPIARPPARDWRGYLKPLASLRLTVVLLALTMIVVFAGTWAQIDEGIWQVQKTYFHSFFCWIGLHLFLPREPLAPGSFWAPIVAMLKPIRFPMLGGYSIIALLLVNLLAAHTVRFKFTKKRIGVILIHAGLIALLLGEVVTSVGQVESRMTITEGQTVSYSEDIRSVELAIVDHSPTDHDNVVAIPGSHLRDGATIQDAKLPFDVKVDAFYPNSGKLGPFQAQQRNIAPPVTVTAGIGQQVIATPAPQVSGTDNGRVDAPSAYITLSQASKPLGTYLVTTHFDEPQSIDVGGKTYEFALRWKRLYKPYSIHLIDFAFDRYTGTNVPKNYSSLVRLNDSTAGGEHEVKIWMNHPLRHAGETLYQSSFDSETERATVLQVVRNPGWLVPYIACSVITIGLLVHFGIVLVNFINRGAGAPVRATDKGRSYTLRPARGNILIASIVTGFCIIYLLAAGRPAKQSGRFDLHSFGRVPISYEGRVLPLDSLARNSLRIISGKSTFKVDGESKPAIAWLVEVFAKHDASRAREVFRIDQPELISALGLDSNRKFFSFNEIFAKPDVLQQLAARLPKPPTSGFEKSVGDLVAHVNLFSRLQEGATLYVAPPTNDNESWRTLSDTYAETQTSQEALARPNPGLAAYLSLITTYASDKPDMFNEAADGYLSYLSRNMPDVAQRANFEVLFNDFEPFYHSMVLYVLAFLLVIVGWLGANNGSLRATLHRTAFWVLALTLAFHTFGLVARIYISGRPPVTNLYSSAIFIGWFVVAFSLIMELIFKNGIGSLAASAIAFPTLLIAHFLANTTPGGDTMAMLQAVLDTNLWLATHVVVITLGYSATALAWILGLVYVIGGLFTPAFDDADSKKTMSRMIYGTVCFAMLFSFVGTILGGIWADQSWGRFWGWDPKENGAVLIVIWNAIVLHARWAGLVRERGLAKLAIFGGVITAWSWFGTNMLGVGLHSYGFMDSALVVLCAYVVVQLLFILVGSLPTRFWRSYRTLAN